MQVSSSVQAILLVALLTMAPDLWASDPKTPTGNPIPRSNSLEIRTFSVDAGGGTSEGDSYTLRGVVAQPDAGPILESGGYQLTGGVLAIGTPGAGIIFCDGFESGDFSAWSSARPETGSD